MKIHITRELTRFAGNVTAIFRTMLETLMPARQLREAVGKNALRSAKEEGRRRLFGSVPYTYSAAHPSGLTYALMAYQDRAIKRCIWDFKYKLEKDSLEFFTRLMADELVAHLSDTMGNMPLCAPALVIYCPSSSFAAGERSWDQMRELSLGIEDLMNPEYPFIRICIDAIQTAEKKESQHSGTKSQRLLWSKQRYSPSPAFLNYIRSREAMHIICIDDIVTTGGTFSAVRNILREAGLQRVDCFALCFTELAAPKKIASTLKI